MSNATAKIVRQSTGPEMSDYLDSEIYNLCEAIQDSGTQLKSGGIAQIRFIELFKVSSRCRFDFDFGDHNLNPVFILKLILVTNKLPIS